MITPVRRVDELPVDGLDDRERTSHAMLGQTLEHPDPDAERRLGPAFDLRGFHKVVLGEGSIPLSVLETNVGRWVNPITKGRPVTGRPG